MPPPRSLIFDGHRRLTPKDLTLARGDLHVELSLDARANVSACASFVLAEHQKGTPIYGMTTGFGPLVAFEAAKDPAHQGLGLLNHLRAGQGDPLALPLVRAMLLARAWSVAQGRSGVRLEVLDAVLRALATPFTPVVPEWGSVGASGDLQPLAHAAGALAGEGEAFFGAEKLSARHALERAELAPLTFQGRDALGLVNGTSLTAAAAGLAIASARGAIDSAVGLTALLVELLGANTGFTHPELLAASGHPASHHIAQRLAGRLEGAASLASRPLQEAYSLRCAPQLIGAVEATVRHVESVVEADLNGVSDNPLFFPAERRVVHGGNFFGQPVAFAADALNLALTQLANLAERQLDLLMDPGRNGGRNLLLAARPGAQSGLAGVNLAAAAVTAAMRRYATPASIQSLPTNGHNQDIVPFGTQAALEAFRQAERLALVQGSLALGLRQAAFLGGPRPGSKPGRRFLGWLEAEVPPVDPDRPLSAEVRALALRLSEHAWE